MVAETVDNALLALFATLVGALIFVLRAVMKRGDDILTSSQKLQSEALGELKRAVETFASFRADSTAMSSAVLADLRAITATQERILEIQMRILKEIESLNHRTNGTQP